MHALAVKHVPMQLDCSVEAEEVVALGVSVGELEPRVWQQLVGDAVGLVVDLTEGKPEGSEGGDTPRGCKSSFRLCGHTRRPDLSSRPDAECKRATHIGLEHRKEPAEASSRWLARGGSGRRRGGRAGREEREGGDHLSCVCVVLITLATTSQV